VGDVAGRASEELVRLRPRRLAECVFEAAAPGFSLEQVAASLAAVDVTAFFFSTD
jgi:hypothetical protein